MTCEQVNDRKATIADNLDPPFPPSSHWTSSTAETHSSLLMTEGWMESHPLLNRKSFFDFFFFFNFNFWETSSCWANGMWCSECRLRTWTEGRGTGSVSKRFASLCRSCSWGSCSSRSWCEWRAAVCGELWRWCLTLSGSSRWWPSGGKHLNSSNVKLNSDH